MARACASGQFINHGTAAGIDDLPLVAGGFGVWAWVLRTSNGSNQHVVTKDNTGTGQWGLYVTNSPGEGSIVLRILRPTTEVSVISVSGNVPLYVWSFICADYDETVSPEGRIFKGTLSVAVSEVTYNTQTNGAGVYATDGAASLYVGNLQRSTAFPFLGLIQRGGIIKGSRPGASGFEAIRLATLPSASFNPTTAGMKAAATHELLFDYQDGGVTDLTGNGHNGTVTGAVSADLLTKLDLVGPSLGRGIGRGM